MPELPDLEYLRKRLGPRLEGRTILSVETGDPTVFRSLAGGSPAERLAGRRFVALERRGPFLRFVLDDGELIMHLMLTGRLRMGPSPKRPLAYRRLALGLDGGETLEYGDEKNMGKLYLCDASLHDRIPLYEEQGVDVVGPDFTLPRFLQLISKKRCQVRVFLMDQTALSAIGNAYADEILFAAGLHPKTPCSTLNDEERGRLYGAVASTLAWGIAEVEKAGMPIEEKVRGHMQVRNRKGQGCPVCGTTIRREQVLGYDTFYCPRCQPDRTGKSLPWNDLKT